MKRFFLLSVFFLSLVSVYGQVDKLKKTERLPVDSTVVRSSSKGTHVIDGSQNDAGLTKSAVQSNHLYDQQSLQRLQLPANIRKDSAKTVEKRQIEPQSVYIERERSQIKRSGVGSHEEAVFDFFKETPQLHIPLPEKQIRIHHMETDYLGITNIRGIQVYRNVPVYGMDFTMHISARSERFMGCTVDTAQIDANGVQYNAEDAIRIAKQDLGLTTEIKEPGELMTSLMAYTQPTVEAIYYPVRAKTYRYCYKVVIRPNMRDEWIYYVDAKTGDVVDKFNNTPINATTGTGRDLHGDTRTVNTWFQDNTHYMVNTTKPMFNANDFSGFIGVYDVNHDKDWEGKSFSPAASSSTNWNNPTAISTMYHNTLVYDYLQNTFQRNSFDGKGANMLAFVNVPEEDGSGYDNAYWNGQVIVLGNGGWIFSNLAGGLDVVAHEWGHAVVTHTANLEYRNQSGAINESYADIFGAMVDRSNWTIGEVITKDRSYFPTGTMRDMANPNNGGNKFGDNGWSPAHVSEMYLGTLDNGGVHYNSGIPNFAYYTYATATSKERAEQVFYRALTTYLTPSSKFIDLRKSVIEAAKDLNFANDLQLIANAFDRVGIIDDTVQDTPPPDLPTNPGGWGLLLCNTDPYDGNSLYKTNDYQNLTAISTTVMSSTPSVTDDGRYTIFADGNNNIRRLDMNSNAETIFNDEGDNQSVAISRDGKRIAVVSTYEDGRIHVYDVNLGWTSFRLYNPTTGPTGSKSGGPRYADAIEFDHTGEYLIYDAFNVVASSIDGSDLSHWDIGLIHIWDNNRNTWGTGEIVKLFSDLTPGVHVMNPVFSKNSPHIIAFDFYTEEDNIFATVGVNLSSGDLDVILVNNIPSFPSFSMDDNYLAFTTADFDWWGEIEELYIGYVLLGNDKITSIEDSEVIFVIGAAYPVYYGTGTRVLGTKPVPAFTADTRSGMGPLDVQFLDMSEGNPASWSWNFQGGSPATSSQQHPKVTYPTAGTYSVTLTATNSYGSDQIIREGFITVSASGSFVAVSNITGVPTTATAGTPLTLAATVEPADATNKNIVWSVAFTGTTGATISGNTLNTNAAGTAVARATIANGATASTAYIKDFSITVIGTYTGSDELFAPELKAYPNPFTGALRITGADGAMLRIANSAGTIVHTCLIISPDETLQLDRLPEDAYFLIFEKDGKIKTVKVMKN